jgi:hypothetical protein
MLITYSKKFTLKTLKNICKIKLIRYITGYNKKYLINLLNNYNAAKMIQQMFRNKIQTDKFCPISHENLKYPFVSVKVNNKFLYYDFYTLVQYLNKTQDFRDPCTRHDINDAKLAQINKLIRYYFGKNTNKVLISKSMIKNTDLNIITYCLNDVFLELDDKNITLDEIYNNVLPRIIYYINYLIQNHSREDAQIIINACKETITNQIILDYITLIEVINY